MEEKVLEILKYVLEDDSVDTSVSQENCSNWDSLKQLNLMVELESEFDISIEPEMMHKMTSYNAIVENLKKIL